MLTLSLVHWLIISNAALLITLAVVVLSMHRQQSQHIKRLQKTLLDVQQTQDAMTQSTLGMGRRIQQINENQQQAEQRILLPHADEAVLTQAARLVELGATVSELVESCGVPRAEAELLVSLKGNSQIRH